MGRHRQGKNTYNSKNFSTKTHIWSPLADIGLTAIIGEKSKIDWDYQKRAGFSRTQ
jgi:hypothetical protein